VTEKRIFSDADLDAAVLHGRQIGLIGYGSQGRAQALNLRDSGFKPLIGVRPGRSLDRARRDGFEPLSVEATASKSDVIVILTPDETQAQVCNSQVFPAARRGTFVGFSTGFAVHFGLVTLPDGLGGFLVAPKGPGKILRQRYLEGKGIPALVASVGGDAAAMDVAMAYAKAIGCGKAGVIRTTFREEAVADLFGEQCVLTGGLVELMKAAFEVLVGRGYSPEVAYIECIYEVEYMASLIQRVGLADLADHVSSTAHYGGVTRGRRLVDEATRTELNRILDEIEGGDFLKEFRTYVQTGERLRWKGRERDRLMNAKANLDEVSDHGD
jgi:ketol-acid reductoisomerase